MWSTSIEPSSNEPTAWSKRMRIIVAVLPYPLATDAT